MATEAENNVPVAVETKEIKEEAPADNNDKAEEAAGKQESVPGGGDTSVTSTKDKEPAPPKVLVHKSNYEKEIVYLYQFSRTPLLPSLSPYCLKVETWLRLAGVKYEVSFFFVSLIFFASTVLLSTYDSYYIIFVRPYTYFI